MNFLCCVNATERWESLGHHKILLLTYKAINGLAPSYMSDLVKVHKPSRSLRSASHLNIVRVKTKTLASCGDRAFVIAAYVLWNPLPFSIKIATSVSAFKKGLKTYLFKGAFKGV